MINTSKIYKMRIVFSMAQSNSSGDKVALLRRLLVQSNVPFAPARQNPRAPRVAYGPAVKQGETALREYADIYLTEPTDADVLRKRLEENKPAQLTILEVKRVPYALAGVQQLAGLARYRVEGNFEAFSPKQTLENCVLSARLEVICLAPNGMRLTTDLKPFVAGARTLGPKAVEITLRQVEDKCISPLDVIYAWLGLKSPSYPLEADERFNITREGLYWQDSQGNLHLI